MYAYKCTNNECVSYLKMYSCFLVNYIFILNSYFAKIKESQ